MLWCQAYGCLNAVVPHLMYQVILHIQILKHRLEQWSLAWQVMWYKAYDVHKFAYVCALQKCYLQTLF